MHYGPEGIQTFFYVKGGPAPFNPSFHRGLDPPPGNRHPKAQALDAFELNLNSQLVIGYHWLAFMYKVHRAKAPIEVSNQGFQQVPKSHYFNRWSFKISYFVKNGPIFENFNLENTF